MTASTRHTGAGGSTGTGLPGPADPSIAVLSRRQWESLDDVLAEMCERSRGQWEDLHDRGRGVLDAVRPESWRADRSGTAEGDPDLVRHIYEVIGALAHLVEAAPDDRRAIRRTGTAVYELGLRMANCPARRDA